MNRQEIIQNNKLIADFMKWEKLSHGYNDWENAKENELRYKTPFTWNESNVVSFLSERNDYDISEMKFNISWDWLMIVVKKIEIDVLLFHYSGWKNTLKNIKKCNDIVLFFQRNKSIIRLIENPKPKLLIGSNINEVYNVIIEFINWYNDNHKE